MYNPLNTTDMKTMCSLLFLLLGTISVYAQCVFSGTVSDRERIPLPGAQVMLLKADSLFAVTLTDDEGKFQIKNIPAGLYGLQIAALGYTPMEEKERKIEGRQAFDFVLEREMNVNLEVVEVTANQNDRVERTAAGKRFFLSEEAKRKGDPFLALQEIPSIISNNAQKTITMADGSTPLILINGIAVNSGVNPIDPEDIESVEVMDVVSARYLRNGVKHILNIQLKEKRAPYRYFEAMTRHDLPIRSMGAVYFEVGNAKYSLYGRGAGSGTYSDDALLGGWQQGTNYFKQSTSNSEGRKRDYLGELLFKWMVSKQDYLAFHIYTHNDYEKAETNGQGVLQNIGEAEQNFCYFADNLDKSNLLTGTLYHKHDFNPQQKLETTLAFNKNWNVNDGERNEEYADWRYRNIYKFDNQRLSGTLNIDYSWEMTSFNSLNAGSETRYLDDKIDQTSSGYPVFKHREWSEYLYGAYSGKIKKFYYLLSAGVEGIWLKAGDESADYVKPRAAVSGTYAINDNHSWQFDYTLTNSAPAIGQLNPYNTSTDSLVVTRGNPDLLPLQMHDLSSSYTFNWKGLYISPFAQYTIYTDNIEPYGYSENEIYISTYRNNVRYKTLSAGGNVSYRLGKWGRAYGYASHNIYYFKGQDPKRFFRCGGGVFLQYKKWAIDYAIDYQSADYSAVSKTTYHMPSFSYLQLMYHFTPDFYISAAIQYMNSPMHTDVLTYSDNYRSFSCSKLKDMSWTPWVLIRYTFRKNIKKKIKLGNIISGSKESGIQL